VKITDFRTLVLGTPWRNLSYLILETDANVTGSARPGWSARPTRSSSTSATSAATSSATTLRRGGLYRR